MPSARASFVIQINYSGDPLYYSSFADAATTWASLLGGYQDGKVLFASPQSSYSAGQTVSTVFIDAVVSGIDGVGGVLGQAGFEQSVLDTSGFRLATDGSILLDEADLPALFASGELKNLILHEIAHVLGFGSLWATNGVYSEGSGMFTGANAIAAWQSEFGQTGFPAVELEGGLGTANAHWNENFGGAGLTGITDRFGRDMRDELMTGWLNPNSFISDMTVASFIDIGFTGPVAIPEPTSLALVGLSGAGILMVRRRKNRHDFETQRIAA